MAVVATELHIVQTVAWIKRVVRFGARRIQGMHNWTAGLIAVFDGGR
jgi:hypothetical protein